MAAPKITVQKPNPTSTKGTTRTPTNSVLDRIRPIGFDDEDGIKLMLYGRSGTGKTTLWATFPGKVLVMVCSGSDQPGELRSIDTKENRKKVSQVVIRSTDDYREIHAHLTENPDAYRTVVLDHVTGFADLVLCEILGLEKMPVQKSFGMATRQQYGEQTLRLKTYLRDLFSLPGNVVIIGQERQFGGSDGDEDSGAEAIAPTVGVAVGPSLAGWLNQTSDYIARTLIREQTVKKVKKIAGEETETEMKTGRVEYCLQVGPSATYHTKFRIPGGVKETVIVNPDYDKIMALVRGETLSDNSEDE